MRAGLIDTMTGPAQLATAVQDALFEMPGPAPQPWDTA